MNIGIRKIQRCFSLQNRARAASLRESLTKTLATTLATGLPVTAMVLSPAANGQSVSSEKQQFVVETIAQGLSIPWGMAALPDGGMLITEKTGTLRLLKADGNLNAEPITNTPSVVVDGQGGLLDVAIHPDFENNGWVYLSFSSAKKSGEPGRGANTALVRGKIINHEFVQQELIFKALPNYTGGRHFGSRIAFDAQNHVYLSVGDRGSRDETQSLATPLGKIYRLHDDGRIPDNNPFVNTVDAIPEVWSWGHRNPQGMEIHPETGALWAHEHGPKGGDELNRIVEGQNYGWPTVTYGVNYSGSKITDEVSRPDFVSPVTYWVPSIAPCGMAFVAGNKYPAWKNNLLIGSLKFQQLQRLELKDGEVIHKEILLDGIGRMRAIEQNSDGYIYIAIETGGRIVRLAPSP